MVYTATNWVEGVTTLGPTNMNKIETELVYLDTRIPAAALSYGTTLPGSPVDGQEAILVDNTTNPAYQWRFRYNASSSSAYKWEFIGGDPMNVYVIAQESTTSTAWVDLPTDGPTFAAPRAGEYGIVFSVCAWHSVAGSTSSAGVAVGATAPVAPVVYVTATGGITASTATVLGSVVAGGLMKIRYQAANPGTAFFQARYMSVLPRRVS